MFLLFYIQDFEGITLKILNMAKMATIEANMLEAKRQNICCMYIFTFMHLADAYLKQRTSRHTFYHYICFLGIKPITLVLLAPCHALVMGTIT